MEDLSKLTTEEIKKLTQDINEEVDDIKTRLKKKKPLNFSTSTDELLRQLIEQLHISNQLSVVSYKKTQINNNINPYQTKGDITERVLVSSDNYTTIVKNTGNTTITGSGKIYEINGSGIVGELKFKSSDATVNNQGYSVRIVADNSIVYDDSWLNFSFKSFHEVDMSCWQDVPNACYLLVFQKIAFSKNLLVEIYNSTASFTDIYLKYHLKV